MMKMIPIPGKNYSLGETTVTQGQWKSVMGTEPWKDQPYVQEGDDYPATYVSWEDAVAFCEKLSGIEGRTYRLPTEAEWEYAYREGTATSYHFSDDPDDPAELNVWEWCSDWYEDPEYRVLRGGSWYYVSDNSSARYRIFSPLGFRIYSIGFRLAIST